MWTMSLIQRIYQKKRSQMSSNNNYRLEFRNSTRAWEELNRLFLFNREGFDIQRIGKAQYINDLVIYIRNPLVDPEFDFGRHFNYTMSKWKSLVANYIDEKQLYDLKQEVKSALNSRKIFNLGYQFDNKHAHGKNCLLSMTVSKKAGMDNPMITVFMRASEVTKRLICDLLLIQRIGEYLFTNSQPFHICIHFSQIFNDDTVLLMYHAHEDLLKLSKKWGIYDYNWYDRLKYLLEVDPDKIKYKVHKRALKVLRPELFKYPKTLAKDCTLGDEDWLPF